jgi:hypothetical protein
LVELLFVQNKKVIPHLKVVSHNNVIPNGFKNKDKIFVFFSLFPYPSFSKGNGGFEENIRATV